MADQDLGITGKDVSIELMLDGIPASLVDHVERFTETAMFQKAEFRPLGSSKLNLTNLPDGWGGEIEIDRHNGQMDVFIDAYRSALANRIPTSIVITSIKYYNDGSSKMHTYRNCELDFGTDVQRGQLVKSRITWRTGEERI